MKKILFTILCLVCFFGTAHAQNPTLVRSTNIISGLVIGGPTGNVYVNSGFSNSHIGIAEHILKGNWVSTGTLNLSGNQILNVGTATLGTNAVNLTQMNSAIASATNGVGGQFINNLNGTGTNTTFVTALLSRGLTTISNNFNVAMPQGTTTNTIGGTGTNTTIFTSASRDASGNLDVISIYKGSTYKGGLGYRDNDVTGLQLTGSSLGSLQIAGNIKINSIGATPNSTQFRDGIGVTVGGTGAGANLTVEGNTTLGNAATDSTTHAGITNSVPNGIVWNGPTQIVNPITTFSSNVTHGFTTILGPSGTIFTNVVSATASLDFATILVGDFEDLTISVTGAKLNDSVIIGMPASEDPGLVTRGFVSSSGMVTIRAVNVGTLAIDQAALTYRATVVEH